MGTLELEKLVARNYQGSILPLSHFLIIYGFHYEAVAYLEVP
jgi:hypothetical protein